MFLEIKVNKNKKIFKIMQMSRKVRGIRYVIYIEEQELEKQINFDDVIEQLENQKVE